ncbi:unnamed protein product [Auanema sp. JU1783]|nr:unnamed protein product [Auanema sp. JU1783]
MVNEREVESDCFTPRDYQVELLEKACQRNIIVQLGTGSGKTFIAVLLLKEFSLQILPPISAGGKRAFFVVDRVALVEQQAEHIQTQTLLNVGLMHGSLNNQIWSEKKKFTDFLEAHNVIVLTAQILLNLLHHAFVDLSSIAVLIFDECHHALSAQHPYHGIMKKYREIPKDERPRMLGLTASLINDKTPPSKLERKLRKLEKVLDSAIETSSNLVSLSKYGARPTQHYVSCKEFDVTTVPKANEIIEVLERHLKFCNETTLFATDLDPRRPIVEGLTRTRSVLNILGPWGAWKVSQIWEKQLKKLSKQSIMPEKATDFLVMGETCMQTIRKLLSPVMRNLNTTESFKEYLPHKVVRLLEILSGYSEENKLSCIIFVEQRYVAYVLSNLLKTISRLEQFKFIRPDYIVGFSGGSLSTEDSQGHHKRQDDVLKSFRRGDCNIIVSTNVLEEGVDVRTCNLVIKFDRPLDYRAYVQSKGRARKAGANYVVLIEEQELGQVSESIRNFLEIEKILLKRSRNVHNPNTAWDSDYSVDDLFPPYRVEETGAVVKLSSAISLINRYCAKLPSDIFTRLVPENRIIPVLHNGKVMYKAELLLPINSPVKEPIRLNTPMNSKKVAQMAVSLEACKLLHAKGELNDNLLPVGRESIANMMSHLDEDPDEWAPGISAKVGSVRRKQLYDKKVARALHDALPKMGKPCYIYVMHLELVKEPSTALNPKKRKFRKPEEYNNVFGFLSEKLLPKIPSFPAYLRQGDMRIHLVRAADPIVLDENTLNLCQHFHHYVFKNVLQLFKANLEFGVDANTPINTIVVPLCIENIDGKNTYKINMQYLSDVVKNMGVMPRVPPAEERKNFKFRPEDYTDAVVMPWYRNIDHPVFYYVAEILNDMSPNSNFPDSEYSTFNEYFIKKYNLEIYDQEQSLLDVDFTSNRLNLLLPRNGPGKRKTRTDASSSQQQIFVPELMERHPINATLWNLIAALPSFFYRLNHLLLADELRSRVMTDALGYSTNDTVPGEDFDWSPLSYPATYEEKQFLIVSKIQQLREFNKTTEQTVEISEPHFPVTNENYEIGVWDPSCFMTEPVALPVIDNEVDETVGLISSNVRGGDMSDDEEEGEAIVMTDFVKSLIEMTEAQPDFAAPRVDLIGNECGWGDLDDHVSDSPFQIIDIDSNGINMSALMADVSRQIMPTVDVLPATRKADQKAQEDTMKKMYVDAMEKFKTEERDRVVEEEVIDLALYDTLEDDAALGIDEFDDEDAEFKVLEDGEQDKNRKDFKSLECLPKIKREGEILAPLNDFKFSFRKPSPTVSRIPEEGVHGDDLMIKNPYGVSPALLLMALTTSNANDGISLERLETIGDSFLKYSVTDYLYHSHFDQHEGKLSFARSKEVSNCNLYRLGKKLGVPNLIVGSKFDVQDSWLPPCYVPTVDFKAPNSEDAEERDKFIEDVLDGKKDVTEEVKAPTGWDQVDGMDSRKLVDGVETITFTKPSASSAAMEEISPLPYNMLTQQYISDKSIADAVEAIIGAHLLTLGPKPTLKVMKWIGLKVLVDDVVSQAPLLRFIDTPEHPTRSEDQLSLLFTQYKFGDLEEVIGYRFHDKAYLLQAFTHASYYKNRITGCYQRLEFLGDAVLDYMITRFLFEDGRQYSPGVLTDLRSALVNNTIFASLAVKFEFHKHFLAMCPGLHHMIEKFVALCRERNFFDANFNAEMYMVTTEEEFDEGQEEDIEVPKALSDIFESVAGAIYLDSGRNLDVVWRVFHNLMKSTIEECCANPPRSPIRELMELEPTKTRFSKMERITENGKVRVTVEVSNKMKFTGMGRNYRIAKTTAAKRALRYLKSLEEQKLREMTKKNESVFSQND